MKDEIREQLSALADDELSDAERPLLLSRLERDPRLRACLGRYQLIGEVMRGGDVEAAALGVADRVQRALADDKPLRRPVVGWGKQLAGLAVAASVALVAILGVSTLRHSSDDPAVPALASKQPAGAAPSAVSRVSDDATDRWQRLDPGIDKRLSSYLVNHNEYAASRGVQGVMPYVRIIGHSTGE